VEKNAKNPTKNAALEIDGLVELNMAGTVGTNGGAASRPKTPVRHDELTDDDFPNIRYFIMTSK
jgi:hypothetical protein